MLWCHRIRSHTRLMKDEVICRCQRQPRVERRQCDRNVPRAFTVGPVRPTGCDAVGRHCAVAQQRAGWTRLRWELLRSIAALLKLSLPRPIKTAALSQYCSAGSCGDLRNLLLFLLTGLSLPRP